MPAWAPAQCRYDESPQGFYGLGFKPEGATSIIGTEGDEYEAFNVLMTRTYGTIHCNFIDLSTDELRDCREAEKAAVIEDP